jgi:hypothetical protein
MAAAITVAAPAGFELSVNGGAYASLTTVGAAGTINATTVSIRLAANTPSGTYSGNITANSTGATQRTLTIPTGTVAASATMTVTGALSAFESTYPNASAVQTFNVSGVLMNAAITAVAPTGFELSVNSGAYASSVTFGAAGTIASTTLSVRLAANTAAGSYSGTITLDSTGAQQRTLSIPASAVAKKLLNVTGLTGVNKVYNGNTTASASGTASLSGVVGADTVTLTGTPSFTFASANVGTGIGITTAGYTLDGANAANYSLTQPSLSANITARELTITGLTGDNKAYDGDTDATAIGTASLRGVVGSDDVSLSGTPVFTFDSANVGTGIAITTSGYTLSGLNAGNYSLTQPSLSANITAHELTVTGLTGENKIYDGNVDASASGVAVLHGVIGDDDVSLAGSPVCTFASANVGVGIAITITGYTLSGADAANYSLIQPSMSATITAHELSITGLTGNDKPHDGNTHATASGTAALNGVIGADEVGLSGTPVFTFASADIGTDIAITTTGYTLTGAAAGNYSLALPSLRASIFEDPLFANPQNAPRVAVLPGGGVRLTFQGIPGRTYAIQRSTTMLDGSWTQIQTVTAGEHTQVSFDDPDAPANSAFYRVTLPLR